ncbi:hypothetical protein E2C01_026327 [Portunus trituberculatus]|uniref:Uncharacterized protein n=1 Tax=Portunus trituberculatus TaxID=210409 RepID=A0A5B7EIJ6_PORTR|nr:hypothetical protein [Portunus trituberculatus]
MATFYKPFSGEPAGNSQNYDLNDSRLEVPWGGWIARGAASGWAELLLDRQLEQVVGLWHDGVADAHDKEISRKNRHACVCLCLCMFRPMTGKWAIST